VLLPNSIQADAASRRGLTQTAGKIIIR